MKRGYCVLWCAMLLLGEVQRILMKFSYWVNKWFICSKVFLLNIKRRLKSTTSLTRAWKHPFLKYDQLNLNFKNCFYSSWCNLIDIFINSPKEKVLPLNIWFNTNHWLKYNTFVNCGLKIIVANFLDTALPFKFVNCSSEESLVVCFIIPSSRW